MYVCPSPKERLIEAVVRSVEDPRAVTLWDLGSERDALLFTLGAVRYRVRVDGLVTLQASGVATPNTADLTARVREALRAVPVPDYGNHAFTMAPPRR